MSLADSPRIVFRFYWETRNKACAEDASSDFLADCSEIPQADLVSGKGFLGNLPENLQADCVQSRQAGFMQCFHNSNTLPESVVSAVFPVKRAALSVHAG